MKKLLFIILLLSLSVVTMAQNKKVAVMETKASSGVTASQSNVVRFGMESAVSKAKGFEGYDRGAFDMIMKEHEFERSGAVDDSQIKKFGQMTGVQYILVTEASAQDGYFYIIAKLLDVETGKFGQAYDALCGASTPDIKAACADIGKSLFIIKKSSKSSSGNQDKKVAVMVPKAGDDVTEFQSNMVRGTMESAISKAKGFEGYNRGDLDIIMKEHDFQRSGAVDDSQIKQLGLMTGVQYILVTEICNTQDGYFSVLAKLLDVETGKCEQAYDEYCAASPDDIRKTCEEIGIMMFTGKRTHIVKKTKKPIAPQQMAPQQVPNIVDDRLEPNISYNNENSYYNQNYNNYNQNYNNNYNQNYNNNYQNYNNYNQNYNNNYNQGYNNYNQYPPMQPRSRVGDVKVFQDGSRGVVFYMEGGRGLAVSLTEAEMQWDQGRRNDIPYLPNMDEDNHPFIFGQGQTNTQSIIQYCGSNARAAYYCIQQGMDWYLPSSGELYYLVMSAKEGSAVYNSLNSLGAKLSGWYWTSTEYNKNEAININSGGSVHTEDKDGEAKVRAIRTFME